MRALGSISRSGMLDISPDIRSNELVLANATQRFVSRETKPVTAALEKLRADLVLAQTKLEIQDAKSAEILKQQIVFLSEALALHYTSMTMLINATHRDLDLLANEVATIHHESATQRWRRFAERMKVRAGRVKGWFKRGR